jgi:hypothetical protein
VLQGIPAANLIEVAGLSNFEQIGVDEFRDRILRPVLAAIADRQLSAQIDYVLYSADLPTAIDIRSDLGQRPLPRVFTPVASINGLTYLYQTVLDKDPRSWISKQTATRTAFAQLARFPGHPPKSNCTRRR